MRATAVIGAAFGDEGKGNLVSYYAEQSPAIVVRYCGGANAGHTVHYGDRRHVFGHFGSGTLQGHPTYLSKFFVANPLLWKKERDKLAGIGAAAEVYLDAQAPLTVPYDMMINQFVEEARGGARHGSCGVGVHETMVRNDAPTWFTTAGLLGWPEIIPSYLKQIRSEYVHRRLLDLGVTLSSRQIEMLMDDAIIDQFKVACDEMRKSVRLCNAREALSEWDHIIFEGSQGLLLDQDNKQFFPHVTHAKTGLHNVVEIARDVGIRSLDVTYVMRAYMTRHGPGAFPTESRALSYADETNQKNQWQGALRFGVADLPLIARAVKDDLGSVTMPIPGRTTLAVTCLDQVAYDRVWYNAPGWEGGQLCNATWPVFVSDAMKTIGLDDCLTSWGPAAKNVTKGAPATA